MVKLLLLLLVARSPLDVAVVIDVTREEVKERACLAGTKRVTRVAAMLAK